MHQFYDYDNNATTPYRKRQLSVTVEPLHNKKIQSEHQSQPKRTAIQQQTSTQQNRIIVLSNENAPSVFAKRLVSHHATQQQLQLTRRRASMPKTYCTQGEIRSIVCYRVLSKIETQHRHRRYYLSSGLHRGSIGSSRYGDSAYVDMKHRESAPNDSAT
jgi:hypothetical protein